MKKLLILIPLLAFFLPGVADAAYNDVSLATTTDLSVNSISLDVSGSDATIESLIVGSTNFTVVLQQNSSFKVSASSLNKLGYDVLDTANSPSSSNYICTGSAATLEVSAVASTTVIVTPSSSLCADAVVSSSSGSGKGSGGGGGVTAVANPVPVAAQATYPTKEAHIQAIMQAIAALQLQIQQLTGAPAASVSAVSGKITTNLSVGSRGPGVKTLQQFLNTKGFTVSSSGPGSSGNETETFGSLTRTAVQKFQEQYNIASPGVPGYGTVGPKTRAKINELSQ